MSDLAGFDPGRHSQTVESVIREVSAWLRLQDDAIEPAPSASQIYGAFGAFKGQVATLRSEALEKESWADLLLAASKCVPIAK